MKVLTGAACMNTVKYKCNFANLFQLYLLPAQGLTVGLG